MSAFGANPVGFEAKIGSARAIGYIPRIRTYPGNRIPKPLLIKHYGDSQTASWFQSLLGAGFVGGFNLFLLKLR